MKSTNNLFFLIYMSIVVASANAGASQYKDVHLKGVLPNWKILTVEQQVVAKNAKIKQVINQEKSHKEADAAASKATSSNYAIIGAMTVLGVESVNYGYLSWERDGAFSIAGAYGYSAIGSYMTEMHEKKESPGYYFSSDSGTRSTIDVDILPIEAQLTDDLNNELFALRQNYAGEEAGALAASFLDTYGIIQSIHLSHETGVLMSFSTSHGYNFVRTLEGNAVFYVSEGNRYLGSEKIVLFIDVN